MDAEHIAGRGLIVWSKYRRRWALTEAGQEVVNGLEAEEHHHEVRAGEELHQG